MKTKIFFTLLLAAIVGLTFAEDIIEDSASANAADNGVAVVDTVIDDAAIDNAVLDDAVTLDNHEEVSDNVGITEEMIGEETVTVEETVTADTLVTVDTVTVITIEDIVEELIEYVFEEELQAQEAERTIEYSPFEEIDNIVDVFDSDSQRRLVFYASGRQELQLVFGEVSSLGMRFELGFRDTVANLIVTADLGGGVNYYGGGLNLGYLFGGDSSFQMLLGLSLGYHATELVVRTEDRYGHYTSRHVGRNTALWGPYARFFMGRSRTIDVTLRVMFGYREDSAWYNRSKNEIYYKDGSTATLSFSIGYDLPKIFTRAWRTDSFY